ncbi:hypothetical protein IRJ86_001599 [Salmonella enterica]|nr:hypothetical protein [Salmonella enterica]
MRSFDQGSIRAQRESVAAGNGPKGEARSEKALPQATARRAKRAALSHPSPTTITS